MEQKINIAELLKDCPKGMELDCVLYENLYFDYVREHPIYPIVCYTIDNKGEKISVSFTWYGKHIPVNTAKCVIFPKGKTTWEGFHKPFEPGDIVITDNNETKTLEKLFPYNIGTKVWVKSDKEHEYIHTIIGISHNCLGNLEYEVKEEKTGIIVRYPKELLIPITTKEPKFKAGDKVRHKNNHNLVFTITSIEEDTYVCGAKAAFWFADQDKYELVPDKFNITTLKPFDKVLVRDTDKGPWGIHFYEGYDNEDKTYPYRVLGGIVYKQCIPYKGNEDLIGLVKDCDDYYKTWINEENEFN